LPARLLVHNGVVYTPLEMIPDGAVLIENDRIRKVGRRREISDQYLETVDAGGKIICPGFIDLQVNGGGGALLTEDANYESVCRMAEAHSSFGTTSFLPTVMTAHERQICSALRAASEAVRKGTGTATVLGSHLEGPFINRKKKGIHDERYMLSPSIETFSSFYEASEGTLRLLTLAPELPASLPLVEHAVMKGVTVSIGHTTASFLEVQQAVNAGASVATHIFNAMEGLSSREPGTVGAILSIEKVRAGLVADGIHVHPKSMKVCIQAKGIENVFLVTDAMSPVGTSMTSFRLGDKEINVRDGGLYASDGTIAGSMLTMNTAVRIINELADLPLQQAIAMATINPATAICIDQQKGSLEAGKDADLVVCDEKLNVRKVLVKGGLVHEA